jgi:hypothetical protein
MKNDPSSPYYRDPSLIETHPVKLYRCAELVIEVCQEQGLAARMRRPDTKDGFVVLEVDATRAQFGSAQHIWLQRMVWQLPKSKSSEPELI